MQRAIDGAHRTSLADGTVIEAEGSSIGIEVVRDVREHLASFPGVAPYRTALILTAETLTPEAQNALLKIAEEPPLNSILLLATTDEARLLSTLRSRVQRVALPKQEVATVARFLNEEHGVSLEQAGEVSGRADGSFALAVELLGTTPAQQYAKQLLETASSQVPALAKAAAADEITLPALLRAISLQLAYTERTARNRELWHRVQHLARAAQGSPLSLRLQIAALFTDLPL
jgi:DNA polymerase-3 subunit delta'